MSGPPYSYNTTIASGATNAVNVTFPYIDKADVHVSINAVTVDDASLTWASDSVIHLSSNPIAGDVVKVYRNTPKDNLAVDWSSPSVLAEGDLEKMGTQLLYIAQEAYDVGILPQQDLDAAINYINTAVNNAQASADAAETSRVAAESSVGALVTAAQASADAAAASAAQAGEIAEFDPDAYLKVANLLSEVATDEDKATLRTNIGAAAASDLVTSTVRYDAAQSLNDTQKGTARSNVGAASAAGGTLTGALVAPGITSSNGITYTYGYSGDAAKGAHYFKSDGTAYLRYGISGDYFEFNKHVYSQAGRLWGSNDFALSALGASSMRWVSGGTTSGAVLEEAAPYIPTGYAETSPGSGFWVWKRRYLQYYINGTWYTAGFA